LVWINFKLQVIMRKTITLLTLLFAANLAMAQQDPMFTNYMFNSLVFNPAYAGSNDHLTINALHRSQWVGIDGAPTTQSITAHTPLANDKVGIGFSLVNDKIGPTSSLSINGSYAYRIPVGKGHLAIGVQGGVYNWRADFSVLNIHDPGDNAYSIQQPNLWKPNLGMGIYYNTKHFYTGLGVPRIIEYDLTTGRTDNPYIYAKQYRHFYYTIGGAIPLNGNALIFKPSLLIKSVSPDSRIKSDTAFQRISAPTEFNIDLSLFFQETLWVGASFRSAVEAFSNKSSFDSVDLWAAYYLSSGMRIGVGYDYTLTKLQKSTAGSFEIMLGWEFDYKQKKTVTPRYF
jgi:type IX secretion system PorP/SprF family membrane protein